jgi:hypothetical protein
MFKDKKGMGWIIWLLAIYLAIGLILFLLVGLTGWWDPRIIVVWPYFLYQVSQLFGGGYI